jgi:pre-mRNA-splicing factor ISY1
VWPVPVKAYESLKDGEGTFLEKLVGRYPKYRMVRQSSRFVQHLAQYLQAGLSDYEVRDLNDEINKLLREKRHWENQIVALGGANYKRNVAMLDDDGKEVPGTKGYK